MFTKEEAYIKIAELVEKFSYQIDSYKKDYNETQTRISFIDPFFEALGWDMINKQGAWEAYREVIHEDKLKIGGVTTAPDYSFRLIGGQRLFFVEAKKPSIVVKDDVAPAYQVRLYGWNAKLAISVVTDFEEFAVYDCSKKPLRTDKASKARINYFTYKDYLKEFDFFWNTFSKQQVIKGGLIKFQQTDKKGTATVDKDFLESLDTWRKELAANIYKNNEGITEDDLNYTVQQTIDRIIFLRIAEDRGLEPYAQLKSCLQNADQYKELYRQFRIADDKYNSGLFHFKKEKDNPKEPDAISGKLIIENKVIKSIISSLYPPNSDYLFNVLPVEILGSAYEQFLGKQIIVKGSRATIEEKPEVRKAGGVYYTPQYIVEYIVENTVGKICADKTPAEVSKLKIVDPACGSGSFLLGAYQYLLKWHMKYYADNPPTGKQKDAALTPDGSLTTAEKKRILINNIYGVDIDRNAVEVTKLSLLLKCMEGETTASVSTQTTLFHERVLPSLENNIKNGNSLIDIDFYDIQNSLSFGEGWGEAKVKPFNWQQNFPNVFKQGGFDCVIGNPPYGALFSKKEITYFISHYKLQEYQRDSYFLFIERSLQILLSQGLLGFIIPNTWLLNLKTSKIREYLFSSTQVEDIVHYKNPVFKQAVVDTEIMIFRNTSPNMSHEIRIDFFDKQNIKTTKRSKQQIWINLNGAPVNILDNENNDSIKNKISTLPILDTICKITQGSKPFQVGKGIPKQTRKIVDEKPFVSEFKPNNLFRPLLRGSLMNRYQINWKNNYWIKFGDWLAEPRYSANYEAVEKIIIRQTGDQLIATLDTNKFIVRDNLYTITQKKENINLRYILGLINSTFLNWYYQNILNPEKGEALAQVKRGHIALFPIKEIDFKNQKEKSLQDEIVHLVELMLQLNKEKQQTTTPDKLEQLQRRIQYTDDKINKIVYKLYGLSEEEIKIVEGMPTSETIKN